MKADELIRLTKEIRKRLKNGTFDEIDFIAFKNDHLSLYEIVISKDYNEFIFNKIMDSLKRLEAGEDSYKVDVDLGYFMAEKYVDPVVDKLNNK